MDKPLLSVSLRLPGDLADLPAVLQQLGLLLSELAVDDERVAYLLLVVTDTTGEVVAGGARRIGHSSTLTADVFSDLMRLRISENGPVTQGTWITATDAPWRFGLLEHLEPVADCVTYTTAAGGESWLEAEFRLGTALELN